MVRRLVQDQQVGALQQQPCQTQPGLLTARKHARQLCPGVGGKAHAVEHLFDLGIYIVGIHRIHHVLRLALGGLDDGHAVDADHHAGH